MNHLMVDVEDDTGGGAIAVCRGSLLTTPRFIARLL